MRILIAEDDFSSRSILLKMLSDLGDCEIAVDGDEALLAFESCFGGEGAYDLICLDIRMPKQDGQQVLKAIRKHEIENKIDPKDSVKVIVTTAIGDSETVIDAFKNGCESYVVKPISKDHLLAEIKRLGFDI